jgi:hypothetical protein
LNALNKRKRLESILRFANNMHAKTLKYIDEAVALRWTVVNHDRTTTQECILPINLTPNGSTVTRKRKPNSHSLSPS